MRCAFSGLILAGLVAVGVSWLTSAVVDGRQPCVTGFNPPALDISASGTPNSVGVLTSNATCAWQFDLSPIPTWLSFPSIFGGNGPATVSFPGVMPNHTGPAR